MRYLLLTILVSPWLLVSQGQIVATAALEGHISQRTSTTPDGNFWQTAFKLVQQQLYLIDRIEQTLSEPDPNQVRAVRGQLFLHRSAVERFLKSQNPIPKFVCNPPLSTTTNSPNSSFDQSREAQTVLYCSLYASTQQLATLAPVLDRQLARRGELAPVGPLPLVSGGRPILGVAATPFYAPVPDLPAPIPPLIGRTAKTPIADFVPPLQPAIAPPPEAQPPLQAAKQLLTTAQAAFPPGTQFFNSRENARLIERGTYTLYPGEYQTYSWFLAQPNTGMTRVLPAEAYHVSPNILQNRLQPTVAERYPFAPLFRGTEAVTKKNSPGRINSSFTPRLALTIARDNFQITQMGLDYGFLVDLGNVPLEKLDAKLQVVSSQTRQFFLTYQPPKQLDAVQVDRRRFLTGKDNAFNLSEPVLTQAPAVLNHTYLMRSLQFRLPEIIMSGQPVSRRDRRYLNQLLEMQSSDVILAFRPVTRRADGSYTVLWRVLTKFPDPKIEDLDKYVKLQ